MPLPQFGVLTKPDERLSSAELAHLIRPRFFGMMRLKIKTHKKEEKAFDIDPSTLRAAVVYV
jgi:hypothetical protein